MPQWPFIVIMIAAVALSVLVGILISRGRQSAFRARENLPLEQIYEEYYRDSDIPSSVLNETLTRVAEVLEIPAGKLRPTDSFDSELGPVADPVFDDVLAELRDEFSKELDVRALSLKGEIKTLDGLVRAVWDFQKLSPGGPEKGQQPFAHRVL